MTQTAVAGEYQKLVWDRDISRDEVIDALYRLGLDHNKVRSVVMRPDCIESEEYVLDEDGHKQPHPTIPDIVWTRVVVHEIR